MLDIRTPIGLMFIIIGILVGAYGLMADKAIYAASLGHNINLMWGLVMLVVGGILFAILLAFIGGIFPAVKAARQPIATAIRAT